MFAISRAAEFAMVPRPARSSCPDLIRASTTLTGTAPKSWITGSSPVMTGWRRPHSFHRTVVIRMHPYACVDMRMARTRDGLAGPPTAACPGRGQFV